jgi:hypothetical protein
MTLAIADDGSNTYVIAPTIVVIGVDGGDSTGIAELTDGRKSFVFQGTPTDALNQLESRLSRARHPSVSVQLTIACERYISGGQHHRSHEPTAQEVHGVVKRMADLSGFRFASQGVAEAKGIASTTLLKNLGLWTTPFEVGQPDATDANMAMRHALLALARYHASLFDRIVSPSQ